MKTSHSSRLEVVEEVECEFCFDCKWVLNDPLHMPYSALNLDALLDGDEIIRCSSCNSVPGITDSRPRRQQQEVITH